MLLRDAQRSRGRVVARRFVDRDGARDRHRRGDEYVAREVAAAAEHDRCRGSARERRRACKTPASGCRPA